MVAQEKELGQQVMWYCWKARPLSDFPRYQRWIIRTLYTLFGWSHVESREGLCICYTEEEAREIVRQHKGGNAQPFPIATCVEDALPGQIVQFGPRLTEEGRRYYATHTLKHVAVPAHAVEKLARALKEVENL